MPTVNQLVRKNRSKKTKKSKSPVLNVGFNIFCLFKLLVDIAEMCIFNPFYLLFWTKSLINKSTGTGAAGVGPICPL